jgi:hypothetical protein
MVSVAQAYLQHRPQALGSRYELVMMTTAPWACWLLGLGRSRERLELKFAAWSALPTTRPR